jgi:uncharacterized membrane protein
MIKLSLTDRLLIARIEADNKKAFKHKVVLKKKELLKMPMSEFHILTIALGEIITKYCLRRKNG